MSIPREINASVNQWRIGLNEVWLDHVIPKLVDRPQEDGFLRPVFLDYFPTY